MRLDGYDYASAGAYVVTICTQRRICLFGEIVAGEMQLSEMGQIATACWEQLPQHYTGLDLDAWVVMPNHVHGIIVIDGGNSGLFDKDGGSPPVGEGLRPSLAMHISLPEVVRAFKSFSARRINEGRGTTGAKVWQRSYYDHIVRNEASLWKFRQYIENNPLQWEMDQLHPGNPSKW